MSADQDWSEVFKAGIENAESFVQCASSRNQQNVQADFVPTSSQSPENSPQASPGRQQAHFPHAQHSAGFCSNSQDQHISQSCAPQGITSQSCEQATSSDKTSTLEPESQQHHYPIAQHIHNKMASPKRNESNNSINYPMLNVHHHPQEFSQRSQPQSLSGAVNSSQANKNLSTMVPSFSNRQPQNQSSNHHQIHLSTPHQSNQQRPSLNISSAPQHLQATRMVSPPKQTSIQQVRQSIPRQIQTQQQFTSSGQPHHIQSAQQQIPLQQRPLNPGTSGASCMYPGKKLTTSGITAPTIRSHIKTPPASHFQPVFPGQVQGTRPGNQKQTQPSMNMTSQVLRSPAPKRNDSISNVSRTVQQQGHPQAFSSPHQGMPQHKQESESDERMSHGPVMYPHGFDDENMYYDEEEEDDDEMDDIDEEEMEYAGFQGSHGYGYPSSDSEELSEEESALLEELRCCEDDVRYEEIIGRLREKGVDPEEIDEMLYHSNFPGQMYPGENYDNDDIGGDGEEDEAEGTVSSSSHGQTPYMRNQLKLHTQTFPSSGQNHSKMYPAQPVGQKQKETFSAPSSVHGQQVNSVPSSGFSHQGMSLAAPALSTDGISQQGKTSHPKGLLNQPQQQVSNNCPPALMQTGAQGEVLHLQQQQSKLTNVGQGNQQKIALQGSAAETSQSTSQIHGWQLLQNIGAQLQLRPSEPSQQAPKAIPQPGQSQSLLMPRVTLMNRPILPHNQAQGQIGAARPQGSTQSIPSGVVVRPVQHLTIVTSNNQTGLISQGVPNRSLVVRQTAPIQQLVISSVPINQQGGLVGTPPQAAPPVIRTACLRAPLQVHQKPHEQQGMPETLVLASGQPQSAHRPVTQVTQNVQHQQSMIHSPRLKAVLNQETAPSEARLARLNVMYMQQSLDLEIRAKKGVPSTQGQSSGPQNPNTQNLSLQNRLPSPQNINQFPNLHSSQTLHPQKQQNQTFPAYQPKHQLPPRQPIPAIVNPNSSTDQTFSGGRPICSVVPFTSQNHGQAISATVQRQNTPQQIASFVRPRNPAPLSPQLIGNSLQHSPVMLQNRMNVPAVSLSLSPPSAIPNLVLTTGLTQGNTSPLISNLAAPQQPVSDQIHQQQPQITSVNRPETFSLDQLSEDKYIVTSRGKQQGLTVNMVYQIRSPKDNSLVLALWNGENFEDLKQSDVRALGQSGHISVSAPQLSQMSVSDMQNAQPVQLGEAMETSDKDKKETGSSALPGSSSKFQTEFMHSLTQKDEEDEQSYSDAESYPHPGHSAGSEVGQTSDIRLQKTATEDPSNQSTYVKPLPQGQTQQKNESPEEGDDEFVFKKPFNENEDYFRVCQYCGYTSKNFKRCEGCRRVFQGEVKIHSLKKQPTKIITSSSGPLGSTSNPKPMKSVPKQRKKKSGAGQVLSSISSNGSPSRRGKGRGARGRSGRTRGGGLRGRMGASGTPGETFESSDSDSSSVGRKRNSNSSGSNSDGSGKRRPARQKSKNPTPRKRSKKTNEPVTVTISSDEDEPSSTSNNIASHNPSPVHSAGSESPIFPATPAEPVNAFGRFRRVLMEDEDGQSKLSKKIQQHVAMPLMGRLEEDEEEEEEDEDDDGEEPPTYEIDIRSVRIGSMRTQPEGPLLINMQGVCFKVRSERTEDAFECEILAQEVEQVKFFSGQVQPVLFLFLTPECGEILRNICHMEPGDDEYFDPSSTDMKQKMVVIIIECFNYMPHEMLKETLSLWADLNHVEDECFIEELTEESANDLLIQSAPPVFTADVERDVVKFKRRYLRDANKMSTVPKIPGSPSDSTDNEPDSTSSSPPEMKTFFGSSVRLLQYPPPPARGIPITTEDLFCLTEGEFLNDVIIDFYLQYLYQEKLTEANRRRTHIFSSFFYKRLTQRDRHTEKTQEDAKKSLPERRHARVKKWTKTVDLFSKDFIIVPINEHSHWYLAVICFPALANSEVVPFIPSVVHKGDLEDESNDTGEEKTSEDDGSQDSLSRTILGHQLDARQCLDNEDSKYNLGQKQPCILMFDSLAGPSRTTNVRMLREYLQCEWNAKKSEARNIAKILRGSTPKVPQQSNYSDCGVYLLQYVQSFFEDPIADFQIPMKGLQNWFPEEIVHNKRREIHELIMSLHKRFQEERRDSQILDIKFESTSRESQMKFNPNPEMNSRPEDGMYSGYSRDDESSNSSLSEELGRAEQASAAMAVENNLSSRGQSHLGSLPGTARPKDNKQDGSDDQDANESEDQRSSHVPSA